MITRALRESDWSHWHRLWTGYLDFYKTKLREQVYEASFARLLSDAPDQYRGLIAERDGTPIGLAHYLVHRDLWSVRDTCYLGDLFVDPAVRGTGAGRALIAAVEAEARKAGAATLFWTTEDNNTAARRLYDTLATLTPFVQYSRPL